MRSRGLPDTGWLPNVVSRIGCVVLLAAGTLVAVCALEHGRGARALAAQPAAESAVKTVVIPVEGMVCVACAASVKRVLKAVDGVAAVEVNLAKRSAEVTYMPAKVTPDRLVAAINKLGYRAGTPKEVE